MDGLIARQANDAIRGWNRGWTLLHYATYYGETECLAALASQAQNLDVFSLVPERPVTPLEIALTVQRLDGKDKDRQDCVRLLIDRGAKWELVQKPSDVPDWVFDYLCQREATRAAITLIGIRNFRSTVLNTNVRDVTALIAKIVKRDWPKRK